MIYCIRLGNLFRSSWEHAVRHTFKMASYAINQEVFLPKTFHSSEILGDGQRINPKEYHVHGAAINNTIWSKRNCRLWHIFAARLFALVREVQDTESDEWRSLKVSKSSGRKICRILFPSTQDLADLATITRWNRQTSQFCWRLWNSTWTFGLSECHMVSTIKSISVAMENVTNKKQASAL